MSIYYKGHKTENSRKTCSCSDLQLHNFVLIVFQFIVMSESYFVIILSLVSPMAIIYQQIKYLFILCSPVFLLAHIS